MTVTERIALTLSPPRRLTPVATLVAGGVAGRLGLSVERVGELQLALSTVLEALDEGRSVTVEFDVAEALECRIGPLAEDAAGLLPVVRRLADGAELTRRDGAAWLTIALRPAISSAAAAVD